MPIDAMYRGLLPFQSAKLDQRSGCFVVLAESIDFARYSVRKSYTDGKNDHEDRYSRIHRVQADMKFLL